MGKISKINKRRAYVYSEVISTGSKIKPSNLREFLLLQMNLLKQETIKKFEFPAKIIFPIISTTICVTAWFYLYYDSSNCLEWNQIEVIVFDCTYMKFDS